MFKDFLSRLSQPQPDPLAEDDARLALTALLVRIARSDNDYADSEMARIDRISAERYGLSPFEAAGLRARAEDLESEAPDTVRFTRAIKEAVGDLGGIDAVICSAGVVRPGGIESTTPDDWRAMFEVNVLGVLNTVSAALGPLRAADHADVVILSSMSGRRRPSVELGFYSASKFAVHVLSDSLHEELAPLGIRVSMVSPGFVNTPIFDHLQDEDKRAQYRAAAAAEGLDPAAVADQIIHQLCQPPGVDLFEIAMLSP